MPPIDLLATILDHNEAFVAAKRYAPLRAEPLPRKRCAVLTCMDTRLTELLPRAMGLRNGDAKIIKNAGGVVTDPFDAAMRDLLLAVYKLCVEEVFVVGHTDCGAHKTGDASATERMLARGIAQETLDRLARQGIDVDVWLAGYPRTVEESVLKSVEVIREHPLLPSDVPVHGLIIDSSTGHLTVVARDERRPPFPERH